MSRNSGGGGVSKVPKTTNPTKPTKANTLQIQTLQIQLRQAQDLLLKQKELQEKYQQYINTLQNEQLQAQHREQHLLDTVWEAQYNAQGYAKELAQSNAVIAQFLGGNLAISASEVRTGFNI